MDGFIGLIVMIPFIAFFILIIYLLVKVLKWNPKQTNIAVFEKITTESEQLRKVALQQHQELTEKLKEVKSRLATVEKILQEVE